MDIRKLRTEIWNYYHQHKRDLPWRRTHDPYKIMVSEIMLQQTQVARVIPKYKAFLKKFPNVAVLAKATPKDVLVLWQGLGYNRRALNLHKTAQILVEKYKGKVPISEDELKKLPGIGRYTAGAIRAFAYNEPGILLETNIRTVLLSLFPKQTRVSDTELEKVLIKMGDNKKPREWYWALMDYGAYLKSEGAHNKQSMSYHTQTKFKGSSREIRGHSIRLLTREKMTQVRLMKELKKVNPTIEPLPLIQGLLKEGFIEKNGIYYQIKNRI